WPMEWGRKRYIDFIGSNDQISEDDQKKDDEPFKDVPKVALNRILAETTEKLYRAKNEVLKEKEPKKQINAPD
ncbi:MAG: hypothetical protein KJ714_06915, partial [Euryarchaeota archaeon]|nr:hypothetical protein [Euryarchaeota archaeon]